MVGKRPCNFAGTKFSIPTTAYKIFSTYTDSTPGAQTTLRRVYRYIRSQKWDSEIILNTSW